MPVQIVLDLAAYKLIRLSIANFFSTFCKIAAMGPRFPFFFLIYWQIWVWRQWGKLLDSSSSLSKCLLRICRILRSELVILFTPGVFIHFIFFLIVCGSFTYLFIIYLKLLKSTGEYLVWCASFTWNFVNNLTILARSIHILCKYLCRIY